jgi:hypothetical protein
MILKWKSDSISKTGSKGSPGILLLPLGFAFLFFSFALFGTWGVLRKSRQLVELQLRLDQCVGQVALDLKAKMTGLEKSNALIKATRAALLIDPEPSSRAGLTLTLQGAVVFQEAILFAWTNRRRVWQIRQGCDLKQDLAIPLPKIQMTREPPDALGPKPLSWPEPISQDFYIQLTALPRHSAAEIKKKGDRYESSGWKAKWTSVN